MLNLFTGGKPDHPMANPKEARRLLEALPPQELKALEELAGWLESASLAEGFKPAERLQLVGAIDDAAQPRLRKVARDYFAAQRLSRYQEGLMWKQMHEYWRHAGLAWARVIDATAQAGKSEALVQPVVRALRALAQQIKWQHLRYGPIDPAVWGVINRIYALAEAQKLAEAKLAPAAGQAETSARLEFLRAAVFGASSPDGLLPAEVEIAERLIAELSGGFALGAAPAPELIYWTDLGQPMAPARAAVGKMRPPQPTPGLRCFGPGSALATLGALIHKIESTRQVPSSANLGGAWEPEVVLEVARHLSLYWAPEPPERQHPRHSVKSRLAVAHGFDGICEALGGAASLDFDNRAAESWIVENVSAGGIGAIVPQVKGDWLRVGSLLAMQPDGGANWVVGVVRRLNRTSGQEARVGIQTLSRSPVLAKFVLRDLGEQPGVLLPSPVLGSGETSIALRTGLYSRGQNLETTLAGKQHVYMPQGVAERGEDYDLIRFRQMVRED
jgi:hypothetical protein